MALIDVDLSSCLFRYLFSERNVGICRNGYARVQQYTGGSAYRGHAVDGVRRFFPSTSFGKDLPHTSHLVYGGWRVHRPSRSLRVIRGIARCLKHWYLIFGIMFPVTSPNVLFSDRIFVVSRVHGCLIFFNHEPGTYILLCRILDTFDSALDCHILYFYLVSNYLNALAIAKPIWYETLIYIKESWLTPSLRLRSVVVSYLRQ